MSSRLHLPCRMTVAEFHAWQPPAEMADWRWQLVDGEPVCMSPPSQNHGAIQSQAAYLLVGHLAAMGSGCRVITTPGIIPRARSEMNERIPDLGATCSADRASHAMPDPVLLIEIVSPFNEKQTRANVWACASIPSLREVLLLSSWSIAAELLRRDGSGAWRGRRRPRCWGRTRSWCSRASDIAGCCAPSTRRAVSAKSLFGNAPDTAI